MKIDIVQLAEIISALALIGGVVFGVFKFVENNKKQNAEINSSGELVLSYSNGQRSNLGNVVGANGLDGKDGKEGVNGTDGNAVLDVWGDSPTMAEPAENYN